MQKLTSIRRLLGAASCGIALFTASAIASGASAAPPVSNACLKDALEYCQYDYEVGTPEFATCLASYKATYCPA